MAVRVLVTGSREWADVDRLVTLYGVSQAVAAQMAAEQREVLVEALRSVYAAATDRWPGQCIVLVHGNAQGADQLAADVWRRAAQADPSREMSMESHPARWRQDGRSAGYQRNARMVGMGADIAIAFHVERSKGTEHAASLAVKAGIPTLLVAWRDRVAKPAVWLNAENIVRFFPPLGRGHRTMWQQMSLEQATAEEQALAEIAEIEDVEVPLCDVCGGEAPAHIAGCVALEAMPVPTRWYVDTAISEQRCGICGASESEAPEAHTETHCYMALQR